MSGRHASRSSAMALSTRKGLRRQRLLFLALLFALIGAMLSNIRMSDQINPRKLPPSVVLRVIRHHLPILSRTVAPLPGEGRYDDRIVWEIRVPRTLCGALIGMLLALAGVAFQSFLQNPLADPYMVGVSSGAALGSVMVILFGATNLLLGYAKPLAAFVAGMLATGTVYLLSRKGGRVSQQTFLLAGVVVGTFLWSLIPLMLSLANRSGNMDRRSAILSQLLGSLQDLGWREVYLLLPFAIVGILALWSGAQELDMMAVSEESAARQGLNTEAFKLRIILAGALVTAAAVSVAGIIAFVGLIVPHITRRLLRTNRHSVLLPTAMLLGGFVLVASDLISRLLPTPLEIGVITSLIGAPVFCILLRQRLSGR